MSYTKKDWVLAVAKLIELTSKEQLKWSATKEFSEADTEKVDRAFEAKLNRNRYVVKRFQRQEWYDAEPTSYNWAGPYYALDIYRVGVYDDDDLVASAPDLPSVRDLFNKADGMHAFQMGILDDLLKPDIFE